MKGAARTIGYDLAIKFSGASFAGYWACCCCHPRPGCESPRVTGFWNRPLAGVFGPNVSWKLPDVPIVLLHTSSPAELEFSTSHS